MEINAYFEIGEKGYEVIAKSFQAPVAPTRDDPGDGGEADAADTVRVFHEDADITEMPYTEFLENLALSKGISVDDAEVQVCNALIERGCDLLAEAMEDEDEYDDTFDAYLDGQGDA